MNLEQTAQYLGISRAMVYELVKRGLLVKRKKLFGKGRGGRKVFFLRKEVEALAKKREESE